MATRHHVKVDERGWVVYTFEHACGCYPASCNHQARKGMAWSPAEDRALLTLARELEDRPDLTPHQRMSAIAEVHGRSWCSVATRLASLRAGLRTAALAAMGES